MDDGWMNEYVPVVLNQSAMVELQPQFRHFTTPSLEENAYLQVRAVNSSAYPLLASEKVAVFFDGSYVCQTALKMIYPGESFSVFLGTDPGVKVEHKLVKMSTNEGKEGTFMTKKQDSKQIFEYVTRVHNTKVTDKVDITVVELLPRSEDDKIAVQVIEPPESAFAASAPVPAAEASGGEAGSASGGGGGSGSGGAKAALASGEGQLKPGMVLRNKITNNVVFAKQLAPQEKIEIPFSYSITWEHDKAVEIV